MELLLAHLRRFITVSDLLQIHLENIGTPRQIDKGRLLHSPGRVCNSTFFITQGLIRTYYQNDDREITEMFSAEGEWITSIHSFMTNIPDNFYIQALEPSEIIEISLRDLEQCFEKFPEMERFGRMLISKLFIAQSERIISLQFQTARQRFDFFTRTSANIYHRVPLGMLASYLGMTQETLSRVRSGKSAI